MYLEKSFRLYLKETKGLTKRTVKNYLSDYRHFWEWMVTVLGKGDEARVGNGNRSSKFGTPNLTDTPNGHLNHNRRTINHEFLINITPKLLKKYSAYLSSSDLAKSTVKRRLSTVRIFCQFLLDQNLIKSDPSIELENPSDTDPKEEKISQLTTDFRRHLKNQGASENTIKNYLADARSYLEWALNAEL